MLCISSVSLSDMGTYTLQVGDKRLSARLNIIGKCSMGVKSLPRLENQRDNVNTEILHTLSVSLSLFYKFFCLAKCTPWSAVLSYMVWTC